MVQKNPEEELYFRYEDLVICRAKCIEMIAISNQLTDKKVGLLNKKIEQKCCFDFDNQSKYKQMIVKIK